MKMGRGLLLSSLLIKICLVVVLTWPAQLVQAREIWEGNVSDGFFDAFLEIYKRDPSALGRYPGGLRNISTEQLHRAIRELDTTHFTYMYPVIIKGHQFPDLKHTDIHRLSLMAAKGEKMIPIPFQFDEFDRTGMIWIEGHNKAKPEGVVGVFDDFDELAFMFRDGGSEYNPKLHGSVEGEILAEIKLVSPRNKPRFAYIVADNKERSEADYISIDLDNGKIESTLMAMEYNPKNFLEITSASAKAGPHYGKNIFDNVYVNISTGILNENLRVSLNSQDNIRATPVATKDGPIRSIMMLKTRIWYWNLPTLFSQKFAIHFYEQSVTVPSRFAIDSMRTLKYFLMFLREPEIEVLIDFHNLNGAQVTFDSVYEDESHMGFVDGKMSEFEKTMSSTRLPGDWLLMDANNGWQMFFANHLPVVEGGLFDAFLEGMEISMVYADDTNNQQEWENEPGAMPRIGFSSKGLPHTAIKLMGAIPKMKYSKMDTLGEAIFALAESDKKNLFKEYDEIVAERLQHLSKTGKINSVDELADSFIADIRRMRFTGIERESFYQLIRDALNQATNDHTFVPHGQVLKNMVSLSKERDIDLYQLRYATMDNTLWFPDWVGEAGPRDFYWQTVNTPQPNISLWPGTETNTAAISNSAQ